MKFAFSFFFLWAALFSFTPPLFSQEAVETGSREVTVEPTPIERSSASPTAEQKSEETRDPAKALEKMMGREKFKAAGLDKLSPQEQKNLEVSLRGYQRTFETKATEKATVEAQKKAGRSVMKKLEQTDSRVDGTMTALTGHSIIRLEDGTVWKQANPEDRYPAQIPDHPSALVSRTGFGWKMRIAGLPEFYVDPVRK